MAKVKEYVVNNWKTKKRFGNLEEFTKWAEDKQPLSGDLWDIEEKITEVKNHKLESKKKRDALMTTENIKKIIDVFLEKATIDNVEFSISMGKLPYKMTEERYLDFTIGQAGVYYMAEKLGYSWEKLDAIYANKNGIMNGRWDGEGHGYDTFEDREFYTNWLAPFFILQEKYNIADEDITIRKYNYGNINRYEMIDGKWKHYDDKDTLAYKYPKMMEYYKENWHSNTEMFHNGMIVKMDSKDALIEYKERIRDYPVSNVKMVYNTGDYKPCDNYMLVFDSKGDNKSKVYKRSVRPFARIPGIMFRTKDIFVTNDNYIGWHVEHGRGLVCDVDDKLVEYCVKNLK